MADNNSVMFSIGHLEGWIGQAGQMGANNAETALAHLKIVEEAYKEQIITLRTFRKVAQEIKGRADAAANL